MRSSTRSQEHLILAALKNGDALTPLDALSRFGSMRLGARIESLRKQGYDIQTDMVRSAQGKRFARYKLMTPRMRIIEAIPAFPPKPEANPQQLL